MGFDFFGIQKIKEQSALPRGEGVRIYEGWAYVFLQVTPLQNTKKQNKLPGGRGSRGFESYVLYFLSWNTTTK